MAVDTSIHHGSEIETQRSKVYNVVAEVDHTHESSTLELDEGLNRSSVVTSINEVPVTKERQPFVPNVQRPLSLAGVPRANCAPDVQHPKGTLDRNWNTRHSDQTVLQQHLSFFDPNHTGIITPLDTFHAVRRLGWNLLFSILATFIIHTAFSYGTCPTILPDPYFRIYVDNIHRTKHGSDTNTYDYEGRFVPQHFEDFWSKWGREYGGGEKGVGVSKSDIGRAILGQRMLFDFFGPVAEVVEWTMTYVTIWPEDGILRKEDVRRVYDGSIFEVVAERHRLKQQQKSKKHL